MREGNGGSPFSLFSGAVLGTLIRLAGLALIDALAIWLIIQLIGDGNWPVVVTLAIITLGINAIFLVESLYPFKWLAPGLALMILMVVYPVVVTVYYTFTNFRTGHLLTKPVAIERITERPEYRILPEGEEDYDSVIYRSEAGEYLLLLEGRETGEQLIALQDEPIEEVTPERLGLEGVTFEETDDGEVVTIAGFEPLSATEAEDALSDLEELNFSLPLENVILSELPDADAEPEEGGYYFDATRALLVDYTGRSPTEYNVEVFTNDAGEFALWLTEVDGRDTILARPGQPILLNGEPQSIDDYVILSNRERIAVSTELPTLDFGEGDVPLRVDAFSANRAARFIQLYAYDEDNDRMVNQVNGAYYEPIRGTFTLVPDSVPEGQQEGEIEETLTPGFYVTIGLDNFERLFTDTGIWGPFVTIFIWTLIHAAGTVFITFALGMAMALLFDDEIIPARKFFRSVILIPYAIPAFISVVIWRGMFDPNLGFINDILNGLLGVEPNWYASSTAARSAILLIQLWLGFPYMMLVITGALQAIPEDMYEAAEVDGASSWQKFVNLTLPLVLVTVGPLLIASFAFNFNNFTVIELYNAGGPAIPNSSVPAGYTDILITYTYAQAFGTAGGTDYAFGATISLFIFIVVAVITMINFRFTGAWEEVSENV